jgi:hypothetical protein
MALTKTSISFGGDAPQGDSAAAAQAEAISPYGVTRQERLGNQADLAATDGVAGTTDEGTAFVDGDSLGEAKTL